MFPHRFEFVVSSAILFVVLLPFAGCVAPSRFENEYGRYLPQPASGAVAPTGMRRTVDGWEDASSWHLPEKTRSQSLEDWMSRQRHREPAWARRTIDKIRSTPPLLIAVIQITAIFGIFRVGGRQRQSK